MLGRIFFRAVRGTQCDVYSNLYRLCTFMRFDDDGSVECWGVTDGGNFDSGQVSNVPRVLLHRSPLEIFTLVPLKQTAVSCVGDWMMKVKVRHQKESFFRLRQVALIPVVFEMMAILDLVPLHVGRWFRWTTGCSRYQYSVCSNNFWCITQLCT